MKAFRSFSLLLLLLVVTLSSCELIGDIFEAGFTVAIILVIVVIALILWIIRKIR